MGYSGSYREPAKHLIVGNEHDGHDLDFGGADSILPCRAQAADPQEPPKMALAIVLVPNDEVLDGFPVTS